MHHVPYTVYRMPSHLEGFGRFGVKRADGRVETATVRGAHDGLVQRSSERVQGDVDGAAVSACFLHFE